MSLRQQVPAAFEIRFSTTDSRLEILEIQPDHKSKENVPDPFKKRDKIPRSSGSIEFTNDSYSNSNSNSSSISNNSSNSINHSNSNTAVPARHSSTDSQAPIRSRHHPNGDNVNGRMSSNSDQVSSLKVKSSNSVGPEADKQLQRLSGGKNLNIERSNSLNNDVNALEEDSIIRNAQSSNKKQRSIKVDEFTGEKEKVNSGKVIPNHQIMDLNGKTEIGISNKIMPKTIIKNKKISMLNNNKDDENKPIPKDGIATPPDTPPRSPARSPQAPSTIRQTRSDNDITDQITLEQTQLATPPPSSSSINSNDDVSTQSSSRVTQQPMASRKRRGSHSSQFSSEMPAAKLQTPRSRRLSSTTSRPTVAAEPQEPFTIQLTNKSKEMQKSQQSQQTPPRSRIPRLSISSRERPVIPKKESQGSLSLSSQGSNRFNDSKESLSEGAKLQTPRELRSATSRPIINTSFITDLDVESESPTSYSPSHSPTSYSSASRSPTNQSPTSSHSVQQKKLTISHDDVIVPTVAKKLKMNGQLHFVNHDALLGYSEEPENISPSTENGYMDITDQVVDLFDNPRKKSHKKKSVPDSQRRPQQSVRKNSHSRNSSKTYYIAPRKQNHQPAQQTYEDSSSSIVSQPENSSNPSTFNDNDRKSRREEYIMVIHDDDDIEFIESSSTSSDPSEPITAPAVQVENNDQIYQNEYQNDQIYQNNQTYQNNEIYQNNDQIYQEKIVEPEPVQEPIVQYNQSNQYNPSPVEKTSAPIATNAKIKKEKKRKQKKESAVLDDDESVRGSCLCRCTIQ